MAGHADLFSFVSCQGGSRLGQGDIHGGIVRVAIRTFFVATLEDSFRGYGCPVGLRKIDGPPAVTAFSAEICPSEILEECLAVVGVLLHLYPGAVRGYLSAGH